MIDLDEIERIANAGDAYGHVTTCATVLALIAEVRALREDAERYRWLAEQVAFGEWFVGFDVDRDRYGVGTDHYMDDKADMDASIDRDRGAK